VGMALSTRWNHPIIRWWFNASGAIPLERGGMNLENIQKGVEALKNGKILGIAPEGTRSYNGCLQAGHPGIIPLAIKSGAPLLPIVYYGGEKYKANLKRLRRTDFHIAVGRQFRLTTRGQTLDREVRQQMIDEIMYQLAAILPPIYRGRYADLSHATQNYINWG
jgi:1-acyl-sn-glycerol-3-phosphate acyltransferase